MWSMSAAGAAPTNNACQAPRPANATPSTAPWLAGDGALARAALQLLATAPTHGLDPRRYGVDDLTGRLADPGGETAAFARDLDAAMVRYLCDLHGGRAAGALRVSAATDNGFDPLQRLDSARDAPTLAAAVDAAAPAIALYGRVKAMLARYRELDRLAPAWPALPPPVSSAIRPGEPYAGAAQLHERLQRLGDLDAAAAYSGDGLYAPALADALRRFQARHGLEEDAVLGPATFTALSVPPTHRIAQLALTLERLRWLPASSTPGRVIAVNVPTYRLWAFDTTDNAAAPALEMRVIVGARGRTATPLFIGSMRHLEFVPYWNVPSSIMQGEIMPKLARNAAYLQQNDMELVGADGRVLRVAASEALARLRAGGARVRQRPGPQNVLGDVKFAMPNPMNIYLHSTSAKELFGRTRRDLSHGCIRVEQPATLAQFVLADRQQWGGAQVAAAMNAGRNRTVKLATPVPVVLFYATALVDRQGRALFAQDIYGRDAALIEALGLE
ncbi:L,D-transpeptidase family protein [Massilia aurea]|uniref:L,D-transpeptidase family protein n=1 Tax=Massilia aurea TaxID=373040 RepID=UPI0034623B00